MYISQRLLDFTVIFWEIMMINHTTHIYIIGFLKGAIALFSIWFHGFIPAFALDFYYKLFLVNHILHNHNMHFTKKQWVASTIVRLSETN